MRYILFILLALLPAQAMADKYVRVQNDKVMEVFGDRVPPLHPDVAAQIEQVPDEVQEGWLKSGDQFTAPPTPPEPTEAELAAEELKAKASDMADVAEEAIEILIDKGIIVPQDFSTESQSKINERKQLRAKAQGQP